MLTRILIFLIFIVIITAIISYYFYYDFVNQYVNEKVLDKEVKNDIIIKMLTSDPDFVPKSLKKVETVKKLIRNQTTISKLHQINTMIPDEIFNLDQTLDQIGSVDSNIFKTENDIEITDYHYKLGNFIVPLYK